MHQVWLKHAELGIVSESPVLVDRQAAQRWHASREALVVESA